MSTQQPAGQWAPGVDTSYFGAVPMHPALHAYGSDLSDDIADIASQQQVSSVLCEASVTEQMLQ